ncbi:uncharacterized protein BP5553_08217 [Venustampulla echinocandica]|uniref:Rhodopsin domain-containing protein n=1 Tax=Venustampulla echinocandica TaxID=2656787 RepID=A0A370TG34_9HELO|nr:uncharacterized protein BP5553_08217 [Venustampulla echinocandica]RDL33849.1 hypothetical protein BP5553_08217 [Venustampulla echinocandica]
MSSEAPPGVDLRDDRSQYIHAAVGTCIGLAAIGLIARLYCRRVMKLALSASDYFIIAGFLAALGECGLVFASIQVGFGRHVETVTPAQLETFLKIFFAAEIFYVLPITLTKISILLLYKSLFPSKEIAIAVYITGAMVLAWATACIFGVIFSCIPVQGFWDLTLHAKCIDSTKFFIGNAIPNIFTDTCILLIPVKSVWQLQFSKQKKVVVSGMFLLGGFVIVASILRLVLLFNEDLKDPTWGLVNAFTWSNIEVDIAVLSACLPTLRPLFQKVWPSSMVTVGGTKDRQFPSDYSNISRKNQSSQGEEFTSLRNAISQDNSIFAQGRGRDEYMMKGITVKREFSTVSNEAEV